MSGEALPQRVADVLNAVGYLAKSVSGIVAVALVGSWARGEGRDDSDVDLIVLTTTPEYLLDRSDWFATVSPDARLVAQRDYGAIQERRLRLPDGLEIEVGIGGPDWAQTDPLDQGTAAVASDALIPIFDPDGMLTKLVLAVQ